MKSPESSPKEAINYYGQKPSESIENRETKRSPGMRANNARELYFEAKSSASVEFPYWYTRRWEELEG